MVTSVAGVSSDVAAVSKVMRGCGGPQKSTLDDTITADMLCRACKLLDFDKALCSPEFGGAPLQTYENLQNEALAGCELCLAIRDKGSDDLRKAAPDEMVLVCIWNWFDGPKEDYRGSAVIIFFQRTSTWTVKIGVFIEYGMCRVYCAPTISVALIKILMRAHRFCAYGETGR